MSNLNSADFFVFYEVFETSSRRPQDVFRDVFKTSPRRIQDVFPRRIQEIFKTPWRRLGRRKIVMLKNCCLQDMSWRPTNVCWVSNALILFSLLGCLQPQSRNKLFTIFLEFEYMLLLQGISNDLLIGLSLFSRPFC